MPCRFWSIGSGSDNMVSEHKVLGMVFRINVSQATFSRVLFISGIGSGRDTFRLDDLTARIDDWEKVEDSSGALDTMRAEIATLRVEMPSVVPSSREQLEVAMHVETVADDESERAEEELADDYIGGKVKKFGVKTN
uniref:Uncharacterized protein n=1 Tax=Solanum tuberosum TaxID=4113 RepID=M1DG90_SOLTU